MGFFKFLTFCFLSLSLTALAQLYKQPYTLGISIGISGYEGDIETPLSALDSNTRPAIGVYATAHLNSRLSFTLFGTATAVKAIDSLSHNAYWRRRNLNFNSILFDGGLRFEFNFLPYLVRQRKIAWAPYLSTGLALTYFNPKGTYNDETYALRDAITNVEKPKKGISPIAFTPCLGGGIKYNYAKSFSIGVHFDYRYIQTDYLDDISGTYTDPNQFSGQQDAEIQVILHDPSVLKDSEGLAVLGKQRASNAINDAYWVLCVTGSYTFKKAHCPFPIPQSRY